MLCLEPALAGAETGVTVQFERQGYFCPDTSSAPGKLIFNRTVGLRDTWAKESRRPSQAS
jgi:glutaminyl-tRNA synthetase